MKRVTWRTAVETLDRAVARRPQVARLYQERARLFLRPGDVGRARADLGYLARCRSWTERCSAFSASKDCMIELSLCIHEQAGLAVLAPLELPHRRW